MKGCIADMRELGIWDTFQVKSQTIKTAIESACMLLRIDDIVSGMPEEVEEFGSLLFVETVVHYLCDILSQNTHCHSTNKRGLHIVQ